MRCSLSLIAAVFGSLVLQEQHTFAAAQNKFPQNYGPEDALYTNLQGKDYDLSQLQNEARNFHLKWEVEGENKEESMAHLQTLLQKATALKAKEAAAWGAWYSGVKPLTLIIEPTRGDYSESEEGASLCRHDLWLLLQTIIANKDYKAQITSWGKEYQNRKKFVRPLTVLFSSRMPKGCYENYMQQFEIIDMYVGLNPTITESTDIDFALDGNEKRIQMITREWPASRDAVEVFLKQLPNAQAKLRLSGVPHDLETMAGRFGQRVMEYFGVYAHGKILYSLDYNATPAPPAPTTAPTAEPEPSPAPTPVDPTPTPVEPEEDKDGKKEKEDGQVDPQPPAPKPDEKKEEKREMETIQIIAWILIVIFGIAAAWYMMFGNKEGTAVAAAAAVATSAGVAAAGEKKEEKGDDYVAMENGEAPAGVTEKKEA
eukprot:GDKI01018075.1.p1 GENE.GDKI01018075.1~~GDKI01018075.1.p1  ORF type:complete len:447 (-),score=130.15 GDKI01018075.1:375-1658(-)